MNFNEFSDRAALVNSISERIHADLAACLARRSRACMALSGGGTPMPVYARLAGMALDWSRVTAIPTDERWVPIDHAASNTGQIRQQFAGSGLDMQSLVPTHVHGPADLHAAEHVLAQLPVPFDLVVVGMGADGHFASLFPHSPALSAGLDPAAAVDALTVMPDPLPAEAPYERISLSLARLLKTRGLLLMITGEPKREVLLQAAHADADPLRLPIAGLLRAAEHRLEIFWSP